MDKVLLFDYLSKKFKSFFTVNKRQRPYQIQDYVLINLNPNKTLLHLH